MGFMVGVLGCATVGGGVALAAVPSSTTGAFTACVSNSTGAVRLIDYQSGRRCTVSEHSVNWSKGYRYRGGWSPTAAYAVLDVVTSSGSSYLARSGSTNRSPAANPSYWGLLVSRGATGPQGAQGPAGPQGGQGTQGPAGLIGYQVVTTTVTVPGAPSSVLQDVACPTGMVPVGGGAHYGNTFQGLADAQYAYVSESDIDDAHTGWASTLVTAGQQSATEFTATAICVNG